MLKFNIFSKYRRKIAKKICENVEVDKKKCLRNIWMVPKAANAKSLVAKKKAPANQSATGLDFANFQNAVSAGYFSMLHVFKYLSTKDRLSASKGQLISECLFDVLNFLKKNWQISAQESKGTR